MTDQNEQNSEPNSEKGEMRAMWIGSAAIVVFILALMGYNWMFHGDMATDTTEISSQSRTAPAR
jgi:hypothetical protein